MGNIYHPHLPVCGVIICNLLKLRDAISYISIVIANLVILKSQVKDIDPGTEITSLSQEADTQASQTDRVGQNTS